MSEICLKVKSYKLAKLSIVSKINDILSFRIVL